MKYKVSVIKKIAFLVMTMALAVAMVACSAAAGKPGEPGPAGPAGPPAETPDPTDTPTPTGEPGPVLKLKDISPLVFNDTDSGVSTTPQTVMLADYFYPTDVVFDLVELSSTVGKMVNANVENGVLTVMLTKDATVTSVTLEVMASNEISSIKVPVKVRRNQPPMVAKYGGPPVVGRDELAVIWVGTQKSKELKVARCLDPNADPTPTAIDANCIPVYIGSMPPASTESNVVLQVFFQDDVDNKLELVVDAMSTSDKTILMVEGGSMVTLMGKKSTDTDDVVGTRATGEPGIMVDFRAKDDNGLESSDTHVLTVKVDEAPKTKGAIGTHVIKASGHGTGRERTVTIADVRSYFTDDRQTETELTYYAWTDNEMYALVDGNEDNKKDDDGPSLDDSNTLVPLVINAVNPGETMVMVMAVEDVIDGSTNTGGLKQHAIQTFKVWVQLD